MDSFPQMSQMSADGKGKQEAGIGCITSVQICNHLPTPYALLASK